jgi:hypothetical protein
MPDDREDDVHVMPNLPDTHPHAHSCSTGCWCQPELDYVDPETDRRVWVHREVQ